jgi:hypothetical protein
VKRNNYVRTQYLMHSDIAMGSCDNYHNCHKYQYVISFVVVMSILLKENIHSAIRQAEHYKQEQRAFYVGFFAAVLSVELEAVKQIEEYALEDVLAGFMYATFEQKKIHELYQMAQNNYSEEAMTVFITKAIGELEELDLSSGQTEVINLVTLFTNRIEAELGNIEYDKKRGFYQVKQSKREVITRKKLNFEQLRLVMAWTEASSRFVAEQDFYLGYYAYLYSMSLEEALDIREYELALSQPRELNFGAVEKGYKYAEFEAEQTDKLFTVIKERTPGELIGLEAAIEIALTELQASGLVDDQDPNIDMAKLLREALRVIGRPKTKRDQE